ncbi:MAG TPA: ArsA-related P-loop ATPase [Solirubrobacteraceae bacterium]|nr:ArsA-related P-loop ATPase [Solirubrobacteraceae bacterium]
MNIPELLESRRICVCAGSGGVGKTTISAVIGLGMAALGRRVCVITIDPARRLAGALGLEELGNEPRRVPAERLAGAGLEITGELWAMMLDPKATFDDFIDASAPTPERAAAVKANPIYAQLSSAVAGSQEFTAVSKLYELAGSGRFDLLVLDTPPARNALDFLDAPRRLTGFLEGRAVQALVRPTGVGVRLLSVGAAPLLAGLRRLTGVDLVSDISSFFGVLGPMTSAFSQRAGAVEALLRSEQTAFVLVASAQRESIDEALWFTDGLAARRLPFAGVVVNRFHHDLSPGPDGADPETDPGRDLAASLAELLGGHPELAARVGTAFADYHVLAARDGAQLTRLVAGLDGEPVLAVPQFDDEIGDLPALARIHAFLFGSEQERARLIATLVA